MSVRVRENEGVTYLGKSFETNSHGFRDKPRAVIKPRETTRIAVLSRSYEMGTALSVEEVWPWKIEEKLGTGNEVLNFSVEAYNMVHIEATYHRFAKNFKPDWVIIPIYYEEIDTVIPIVSRSLLRRFQK